MNTVSAVIYFLFKLTVPYDCPDSSSEACDYVGFKATLGSDYYYEFDGLFRLLGCRTFVTPVVAVPSASNGFSFTKAMLFIKFLIFDFSN